MGPQQLHHYNSGFKAKQFPIYICCDHITGAANIGAIFRLADAFGVKKIFFIGTVPEFTKRTEKTSRSTHKTVPFELIKDYASFISLVKSKNYHPIALEITNTSAPIQDISINPEQATVLIIGNENHGVGADLLDIATRAYHINMYGQNSSMNIAQATGISLYELTNKYNTIEKR